METQDLATTEVETYEQRQAKAIKKRTDKANSHYFNIDFNKDMGLWTVTEFFTEEGKEPKLVAAFPDLMSARNTQSTRTHNECYPSTSYYDI